MSDAAARNARRQRGCQMHRALRPQDEISRRITRDHHAANIQQLRQTEQNYKQRQTDHKTRPAFKMKRFQQVSARVHDSCPQDVELRSKPGMLVGKEHVPKRKLGHVPPYLRKLRAQKEQDRCAQEASNQAPAGFRLLSEEQRASVLETLHQKLMGLEKDLDKRFPAHKHVASTQMKAQQELIQQIDEVKAMQTKFSMKNVWVEIEDDDTHDSLASGEVDGTFDSVEPSQDLEDQAFGSHESDVGVDACTVEESTVQSGGAEREESCSPDLDGLDAIRVPHDLKQHVDVSLRVGSHKMQTVRAPWATDDDQGTLDDQRSVTGRSYGKAGADQRFSSSIQFG